MKTFLLFLIFACSVFAQDKVIAGTPLTLTAVVDTGTPPITYAWSKDGTVIPGVTGATYSVAISAPSHSGSYTVTATNAFGSATSMPYPILVGTAPTIPVIRRSPPSLTVSKRSTAVFTVEADGADLRFEWWHGSQKLFGESKPTLTLTRVNPSDAGVYTVVVKSGTASVSSSGRLTVL